MAEITSADINPKTGSITIRREEDDDAMEEHIIPAETLASWGELLGIDDPGDVLEAILFVNENGEPDPNPETGENAWTGSYLALMAREQAKDRATIQVQSGEMAPRKAMSSEQSALDANVDIARAATRSMLGLSDPSTARVMQTAGRPTPMSSGLTELEAVKDTLRAGPVVEARSGFLRKLSSI